MTEPLAALRAFSARIGADRTLVQAAGGNTSLKQGDTLRVKASGMWLRDAAREDIFVSIRLPALRDAIVAGDLRADSARDFVTGGSALRPSIEASLHAILPHPVVVHVHCVDTIAWACLPDAAAQITSRLSAHRWAFVPYVRPGLPLARAILASGAANAEVLVLGNHGLVVTADSVDEADARLTAVRQALGRPLRRPQSPDTAALADWARASGRRLPAHADAHAVAIDPIRLRHAVGGSLYPDHVIFLGPAAPLDDGLDTDTPMILRPSVGMLLASDAAPAADEMAVCLADVTGRLGEAEQATYLTKDDEAALLGWDAEAYRRQLRRV